MVQCMFSIVAIGFMFISRRSNTTCCQNLLRKAVQMLAFCRRLVIHQEGAEHVQKKVCHYVVGVYVFKVRLELVYVRLEQYLI